jgi:hypothetical protein
MSFGNAPKTSDEDYETVTLMKLREAERRRLAEKVREDEKAVDS